MHEHLPARRLKGGLRLHSFKAATTSSPIRRGLIPRTVVLGLHQNHGAAAVPTIRLGDSVLRGQPIAIAETRHGTDIHASTSGRIIAIEQRAVPTSSGIETMPCIVIESDGLARAIDIHAGAWPSEPAACIERIARAGIVGLGGAAFPTALKLAGRGNRTLILNGAECEPYISCDDMLMRERAADIIAGAELIAALTGIDQCIIAIERDKAEAIEAMHTLLDARTTDSIRIAEVPTIYPAGGERQLIDVLTGIEVPTRKYPNDIGIVCQNVGTAYAVARLAETGQPLTSRIVTIGGATVREPANIEAPIGTPIHELLEFCGGCTSEPAALIHGGSMMGYALPSPALPISKSTNCVIAAADSELKQPSHEWPCIRCGECGIACPARLQPQDLLVAAREQSPEALNSLGLLDCIECGCCDVVCPSHIPLTEAFRRAKRTLEKSRNRAELSTASAERFRERTTRAENAARAEESRQHALKAQASDPDTSKAAIAAAVERARRRRGRQGDRET